MRLMSFAATVDQMLDRSKTVTRRLDLKLFYHRVLKPGDLVLACAKTRGVKREDRHELGVIEIVKVTREPLTALVDEDLYCAPGYAAGPINFECLAEGFDILAEDFIELFCEINGCKSDVDVTRIEFRHVEVSP